MTNKSLNPQDFKAFRDFLQEACGIDLGENKQYLVTSRLGRLLIEHKLSSLSELMKAITTDVGGGLREKVINAMTTNETLWFRDVYPFEVLEKRILPEMAKKLGSSSLRIWSAASSTGQEPYSISMNIDRFKSANPGAIKGGARILATDISTSALDIAMKGEYEALAIGRGLAKDRLEKYFSKIGEGRYKIKPDIAARVEFKNMNLMHSYTLLGKFDVVFCRNVLIYFSSDLKKDILNRIHSVLKPGGYLILGSSEALSNMHDKFDMIQCKPGIIYQAKG